MQFGIRDLLSASDTFRNDKFNTDDVIALLKKLQPLQPEHPGDYNTVVERFIHGMVAYGSNELTICRLAHAEIPFDPVACLEKMARAREESWPMVLRLVGSLTKVGERREQAALTNHYHAKRQERVLWDPEWRNPTLAGEITAAFMGWMEKKKNRIPRPLFSGNFLQNLASTPGINTLVPGFPSRAVALWSKNVDPSDLSGAATTLAILWPGLAADEKASALALLKEQLGNQAGADTFTVLRLLGDCDLPSTWLDSFLPHIDAAVKMGNVSPHQLGGLSVLAKTEAGGAAVADWVVRLFQGQHEKDIQSFAAEGMGSHAKATSYALQWIETLAHPSNTLALQALQKHNRLTDVMTLATMSFLTDRSVAYRPKNEALSKYESLMSVLGRGDFMEKFDAAYDLDVGRHGCASLLAALSPTKGRGIWSTAEALYMDNIIDGTLVTRVEIRGMIHDLVGEVFDPSRSIQENEVDLSDIML